MKYAEEDLRKAYRAGFNRANAIEGYAIEETLTEEECIDSLKIPVVEEDKISFTYSFLRRKVEWTEFCDLTGIDYYAIRNGFEIKDNEIFYITESKAKEFNLL